MRNIFEFTRIAANFCLYCTLLAASAGVLAAQTPATPAPAPVQAPAASKTAPAPAAAPAPASPAAPAEATTTLSIRVTGIRNTEGKIHVVLFRDGKGFPSDPTSAVAARQCNIDPQTLTAKIVFEKLPQGVYAVAVLHDENLSGKMEYDSEGIPLSGYGISNNPDTSQGPPTADQANFKVDQPEATIEIKMVYWQ